MQNVNVQDVFNKVIDCNIYPEEPFMCNALFIACEESIISDAEYFEAKAAVDAYIGEHVSLRVLLKHVFKDESAIEFTNRTDEWAASYGVDFYRNWENRPAWKKLGD